MTGPVVRLSDIVPDLPMPDPPRARVCVLFSVNFPDLKESDVDLVTRFTRTALATLIELGASYEVFDTTAALDNASAAADFDGLLLLGGGDVDGACYGSATTPPNSFGVDARADRDALDAIAAAETDDRPILGICRGVQLLNVYRGGTLLGDIADYTLHHGAPDEPLFVDEPVDVVPGTRLAAILGKQRVTARSGHHQAVDALGAGLVVAARALDGLTEAVEDPDRFLLGVQWHPEDDLGPDDDRRALFGAFVAAAERVRSGSAAGGQAPTYSARC